MNILGSLLLYGMIGWAKEARTLSFNHDEVRVCGQKVSWKYLMPDLTVAETECLDSNQPLDQKILWGRLEETSSLKTKSTIFSLSRNHIVGLLKAVKPVCLDQVELKIPDKIQMNWVSQLHTGFFQSWLESELKKNYANKIIKVLQVTLPKIDCLQAQSVEWGSLRVESKNTFRLLLVVDDKNFGVSGEFRVLQNIPVAKRNISIQEKISKQDFELQEKDVTFSPGYVSDMEELMGKALVNSIAQGTPVELKNVKKEFIIEKGQMVQIQFQGQNFIVSANAIAEQSGMVGDLIKIKNTETQKILSGVVAGKGLVEVK